MSKAPLGCIAALTFLAATPSARAADLGYRPTEPLVAYDWTGFYVGLMLAEMQWQADALNADNSQKDVSNEN
jgi:hypothetical protein